MRRPVWLLSMDTENFHAPPMTTGGLAAHFHAYGRTASDTEVALAHFLTADDLARWRDREWPSRLLPQARAAVAAGHTPVLGLSCYTWNVAEFLEIARRVKGDIPETLVVAGGPHVQRAEDFLFDEALDVVVLGEGEETFTALLDCGARAEWAGVAGCAWVEAGALVRTPQRPRSTDLDRFPSALDLVPLRGPDGAPLYREIAYETSRGCPFRCAFCEWGTGAIGTKIHQFSLARIRRDLERVAAGGIHDVWLCDSNFAALREDEAKAELLVELRQRTGMPRGFATSWSKNHNGRVQRLVRLLHAHGLLSQYHLALQTITPRALALSHRTNMRSNDYAPIAKALAEEGIPIAAELIWGLPGDTLADFEANLDHLLTVFPNVNIFGYVLLPGTEFYERRAEYRIETLPVAGYGKAKGEYLIGCHTFDRDEGEEGYFMLAAYIVLSRGQLMRLTTRHLAFARLAPVARLLRSVMDALLRVFGKSSLTRIEVYESRSELFVLFVRDLARTYAVIRATVLAWLARHGTPALAEEVVRLLALDEALCPRAGAPHSLRHEFDFAADEVERALARMDRPDPRALVANGGVVLRIEHPAGVGELLRDPDGGEWMRGRIAGAVRPRLRPGAAGGSRG